MEVEHEHEKTPERNKKNSKTTYYTREKRYCTIEVQFTSIEEAIMHSSTPLKTDIRILLLIYLNK